MVPLCILLFKSCNVLIDFLDKPLIEFGFDIFPNDLIDFTDFSPIKFYYKLSTDAKISYSAILLFLYVSLLFKSYLTMDCCLTCFAPAIYNY